jgi:hypothetical protein
MMLHETDNLFCLLVVVPYLNQLAASFPSNYSGLISESGHVEYVVDKVTLGKFPY